MLPLSEEDRELLNRLNRRPDLKKRMESILSIAEDEGEGIVKADEAESRIIEEVRRMGNEVLTGWAESRIEKSGETLPPEEKTVCSGKKKSGGTRHSEKFKRSSRNTDSPENGFDRSVKVPE
jgi:hypothetical protein